MFKTIKNLLWTLPFISFITGYVTLTVLYPQKELETPALVGKNTQEAFMILSRQGLNPRLLTFKEDALLPEGTIISQTPSSLQKIKQNQSVFLVISTQPAKKQTPSLVTKSLPAIAADLEQQHIRFKSYIVDNSAPKDLCIAQWPMPGQLLDANPITLYISAGPHKKVLVPDLKNKPIEHVIEALNAQDITTEVLHYPTQPDGHHCTHCLIIDQRPLAGSIMRLDTEKPFLMQLQVQPSAS
ncbi:MAG: PASTA domain-containing protein [Candidatus Dependentiae bacterium]|nr:PASTA domain-containing protein [Candidatus Dependentiae bacterium]